MPCNHVVIVISKGKDGESEYRVALVGNVKGAFPPPEFAHEDVQANPTELYRHFHDSRILATSEEALEEARMLTRRFKGSIITPGEIRFFDLSGQEFPAEPEDWRYSVAGESERPPAPLDSRGANLFDAHPAQ